MIFADVALTIHRCPIDFPFDFQLMFIDSFIGSAGATNEFFGVRYLSETKTLKALAKIAKKNRTAISLCSICLWNLTVLEIRLHSHPWNQGCTKGALSNL